MMVAMLSIKLMCVGFMLNKRSYMIMLFSFMLSNIGFMLTPLALKLMIAAFMLILQGTNCLAK